LIKAFNSESEIEFIFFNDLCYYGYLTYYPEI